MSDNGRWSMRSIPAQTGRVSVVTGANSGIGFQTARELARKGSHVVMACRNIKKANEALARIRGEISYASIEVIELDLGRLDSVRAFAQAFKQKHPVLHKLINNAGVMALPYNETEDGFEMQFGTNHLGHFALTGLLIEHMFGAPEARVVTVSSYLHEKGQIYLDNLNLKDSYDPWVAYHQSKLANVLFAYELQRRLKNDQKQVVSVAVNPGYVATNLQKRSAEMGGSVLRDVMLRVTNVLVAQRPEKGARSVLYAATAPQIETGDYISSGRFWTSRGRPAKATSSDVSHDEDLAIKLWKKSEEMTGIQFPL